MELGCANGANLLPMAWYRRNSRFVGVDGSARQIETAEKCRQQLGIDNIRFLEADFLSAGQQLEEEFDFIIVHGVFSWVSEEVRNALLDLCVQKLAADGLLYLNYNTRPGWNIRGAVREFLLKHTAGVKDLETRTRLSQELSARVIAPLGRVEHHYTQLLANEFNLVRTQHPAYIAHEYLAPENVAYWRGEFLALTRGWNLKHVADADFNSITQRSVDELTRLLASEDLSKSELEDSVDMLSYRQMHSPIMTHSSFKRVKPDEEEIAGLFMASSLESTDPENPANPDFRHPNGTEITVFDADTRQALLALHSHWPQSVLVRDLYPSMKNAVENVKYLARAGLVELRYDEPGRFGIDENPLKKMEVELRGHFTTPNHKLLNPEQEIPYADAQSTL
jgi:trans-aconitate methyltransferase